MRTAQKQANLLLDILLQFFFQKKKASLKCGIRQLIKSTSNCGLDQRICAAPWHQPLDEGLLKRCRRLPQHCYTHTPDIHTGRIRSTSPKDETSTCPTGELERTCRGKLDRIPLEHIPTTERIVRRLVSGANYGTTDSI